MGLEESGLDLGMYIEARCIVGLFIVGMGVCIEGMYVCIVGPVCAQGAWISWMYGGARFG